MRLNRYLASAGLGARRKCDEMILAGLVMVNGQPVQEPGLQIEGHDVVTVSGETVRPAARQICVVMNKPAGYVVTMHDPQRRPAVYELLRNIRERVFPVGRLDIDVEGLLVLTNDGELAHRLAHPRYMVEKVYEVEVRNRPSPETLRIVENGLQLDDGPTAPVGLEVIRSSGATTHLKQRMHEGRKRQVKRMWAVVGHPVVRLRRVGYAGLKLNGLEPGQWRRLTSREIRRLRQLVGLP